MDIISHGLYGGVAFGRTSKISYWKAFFFGIMPDLFSFGVFFAVNISTLALGVDFRNGPPDASLIPSYVHSLYNVTHSLIIAALVIGTVWLLKKKPMIELFAWPLHIIVDMPVHTAAFFPTPFLWPISDVQIDGVSWSNPYIFLPNLALLTVLYVVWYLRKRKVKD
jgi:hypothetical protein